MSNTGPSLTPLNLEFPVWDQIYTVHPLVIVGTKTPDGRLNFAPKHMAFPLGWDNYFGFVCTPRHRTYQNILEMGEFTVTYPRPDQVVVTSLTAMARDDKDEKPILDMVESFEATEVDGSFVDGGYVFLECRMTRVLDGFGENSLILSEIVAASAWSDVMKNPSQSDNESIYFNPQLAYVSPGRFAVINETQAFPYPEKFKK